MVVLPLDCSDEDILNVARRWTEHLAVEDYTGAFDMLLRIPAYPGKSWVSNPEALRAWVVNYGSDKPIPGEPVCRVTPIESAAGEPPAGFLWLERHETDKRYAGCRGRLDWPLPLNGAWSDLKASFDLVARGQELAFVLVALRVP